MRVARPRELRPRHAVQNQWDLLAALGLPDPDAERLAGRDAGRSRLRQRRWPSGWRVPACARPIGSSSCTSAPATRFGAGRSVRSPRWSPALASTAGMRVIVTSGPSEREAARRVIDDARGRLAPSERDRGAGPRRVLAGGASSAARARGAVHRRRQRAAPHRGDEHGADRRRVWTDAARAVRAVAGSSLVTESVEVTGLPCRPCDQRVCAPGDFRCLTRISADMVFEASDRALARANRT